MSLKRIGQQQMESRFIQKEETFSGVIDQKAFLLKCRTPQNQPLYFEAWHWVYWDWLCSDQITDRVITGCAQIGKTLFVYLSTYENLINRNYSLMWAYPTESIRNVLVKEHHKKLKKQFDFKQVSSDTTELFQSESNSISFIYVRGAERNEGGASAKRVGFTAYKLIIEEASQYNLGDLESVFNRLDASPIPSHPKIFLGTPGSGGGIETYVKRCFYQFYPHANCPSCKQEIELNPKGCLLKPITTSTLSGNKKITYLSESGKPIDWHHLDGSNAVETAYFGCYLCGQEIPDEVRIKKAYFKCKKTGVLLTDYLTEIKDKLIEVKSSSIELSPLLRSTTFNLAAKIIDDGLNTANPDNWQQQSLGLPSELTTTQLTLEIVNRAIGAPLPDREPNFVLAGIDQGRSEHWMVVIGFYLPEDWELMTYQELNDKTIRGVLWCGGIQKGEIPELMKTYDVNYGLIDNEPDIVDAFNLCEFTGLEMADQRSGQLDAYKEGIARHGGEEFPCWRIHQERFLKQVIYGFNLYLEGYPLYRAPLQWEKWLTNHSERSPIKHLCSPSYDPETGKWIRAKDHVDDIFYAFHFCEAAFSIYLRDHTQLIMSNRAFGL